MLPENKHKHDAVIRMGQEQVPKAMDANGFSWLKDTTSATTSPILSPITNGRNKKVGTSVGGNQGLHDIQMADAVKPRQRKHSSNDDDDDEVLYANENQADDDGDHDFDGDDMYVVEHAKTNYGAEGCNPEHETGALSKGYD